MLRDRMQKASRAALLVLLCLIGVLGPATAAEPLTVQALVEKNQVILGAPFLFQIRVDGSESPQKPDLAALSDFSVEDLGGQQNSSQSVTIINGRMQRVVQRGYVFSYRLTAKKKGMLTIPAIAVTAGAQRASTRPVTIRVAAPSETEDFKLRVSLSEKKAYVGQPVVMTFTWYLGKNVQDISFNLPVLTDKRFQTADPQVSFDPNRNLRIPLGAGQVIAEKGQETLDGKQYMTVQFRKILIPKQAGAITLPQATVAGKALQGYQQNRRRSVFDDFFNDDVFNLGRRAGAAQ